ncbi:MAG: phosphatidylserine decarboxylase [Bacteroidetes bacterium]|nr:MAG: phosphatidylserine decarboxylase [Bacteroidota bacterium]
MPKRKKTRNLIIWISLLVILLGLGLYPTPNAKSVRYIDRQTSEIKTEKVAAEAWLKWLYYNPLGEVALQTLVKRKFVSDFYGWLMDTHWSVKKIKPFVKDFNIDLSIAQKQHFTTFNDFFTRKLKPEARPVNNDSNVVVSPGDGKILAYQNIANQNFIVKGYKFDINTFLQNDSLATLYRDGSMLALRLCPTDYHRYHFPIGGTVSPVTRINGELYSVSPIALHSMVDIFLLNKREYIILANRRFGDVIMVEVGATMVGSIVQTYTGNRVKKGREKGYFKFGGSSIVLLFKKDAITIDSDLLTNTKNGFETQVNMGEEIAKADVK